MGAANSLAVASLEASINFDGHAEYLDALLTRENLDLARRSLWRERLDQARARRHDRDLYLAVVGEFSSGKSTLVNALIQEELLPADVLPATTATAILVRSGPRRRLRVEYLDGRMKEITDGDVSRQRLGQLITSEEIACTISRITIDHPAPVLAEGFVAIDLPGANVENARHVAVAGQALRHLCDTALVAIPANIPVSETLADFLRTHLTEVLHRCVFVVTKIDCVTARDRGRVLETVQRRLAAKLDLTQPLVLPASASAFLGESLGVATEGEPANAGGQLRELKQQFLATERRMVSFFHERRQLIHIERTATRLEVLFNGIQEDLRTLLNCCHQDRDQLSANLLPTLRPFLDESRIRHGQALAVRLQALADKRLQTLTASRQQVLGAIWTSLASAQGRAQVAFAATSGADAAMTRARAALWEDWLKAAARVGPELRAEVAAFQERFLATYRAVAPLHDAVVDPDLPQPAPTSWPAWTRPQPVLVASEEKRRKSSMSGGATIGLFVGSWLFVILGLIGACSDNGRPACSSAVLALVLSPFLLAFLCGNVSASTNALRKAYWGDLSPSIEAFFSQLETPILRLFAMAQSEAKARLDAVFDAYQTRYDSAVRDAIDLGERRMATLLASERRTGGDLADIERRRLDLRRALRGLREIQNL
jgi:Dynamin family